MTRKNWDVLSGRCGPQQQFGSSNSSLHCGSHRDQTAATFSVPPVDRPEAKGEVLTIAGRKHHAPPSRACDSAP